MRPINEIIIHCTATRPDFMAKATTAQRVEEIRRWHRQRGWRDIGYHFLIDRNGVVARGRPVAEIGAHVRGHNRGTIGISLFGGHGSSENDEFSDNFTKKQDQALRKLLDDLKHKYGDMKISGHNEYAAKACPGFQVSRWLSGGAAKPPEAPKPAPKAAIGAGAVLAAITASVAVKGCDWFGWFCQ